MSQHLGPVVPNPTVAVNPNEASLKELAACDVVGPIAMLNLLQFDGSDGRAAYGRYAQVAAGTIATVGGSLMYFGQVVESDTWDSIAVIFYPGARAYLAMQGDQDYITAVPDRTAGLRARLLYPFALPEIDASQAAELIRCGPTEVMETQLVRRNEHLPQRGDTGLDRVRSELRLSGVGGGLVTDGRWDELALRPTPPSGSTDRDPDSLRRSEPDVIETELIISEPAGQP